jgi:maternal embryonic leucine zipper kinase
MKNDDPNINVVFELIEINKIPIIPLKDIMLKKKIGEGGQAKVYNGTYKGLEVAVKVIANVDWKCFAHEIVILSNLTHECIPTFYGMVVEENILATVIKYIKGKTLNNCKVMELKDDTKMKIAYDLGTVLNYIHTNNFIHRDLKPENIILDENHNMFLIDFGIAKICTNIDFTITRAKGTIYYLAPECLDAADYTETKDIISLITTKVDVWGYGCILSYLYSGYAPWCEKGIENPLVVQKLLMQKIDFPIPNNITDEKIIQVIKLSTLVDPNFRSGMSNILEVLCSK